MPKIIKGLKISLQKKARKNDHSFVAIGVSKDWSIEKGLNHLSKFGNFDEVMTGMNWLNTGVLKYVWEDIPGAAATPQVLLIDRTVEVSPKGGTKWYALRDEHLLKRVVGTRELRRWVDKGAPVPSLRRKGE